jgi:hypothetical protein
MKMNTKNFKIFIETLEALPEGIRNNRVDMNSTHEPVCGTVGCFAGLISIVAKDIPELEDLYGYETIYFFHAWVDALNEYLDTNFREWAEEKPEIWGNAYGWNMFTSITAFGKEKGDVLTHDEIIVFLRNAYDRWANLELNNNKEK